MNLLLAADQIGSIILLGVLIIFLVASPFIIRAKNKKEMDNAQKMIDSIDKGDTVLTASGVIGKVISIQTKEGYKTVTIETGNEHHKGYITLDIGAVYANLSAPVVTDAKQENKEDQPKEEDKPEEVVVEEPTQEVQEQKVEDVQKTKKTTQKKSTKNSKSKK